VVNTANYNTRTRAQVAEALKVVSRYARNPGSLDADLVAQVVEARRFITRHTGLDPLAGIETDAAAAIRRFRRLRRKHAFVARFGNRALNRAKELFNNAKAPAKGRRQRSTTTRRDMMHVDTNTHLAD